jgi:hypothetical protein
MPRPESTFQIPSLAPSQRFVQQADLYIITFGVNVRICRWADGSWRIGDQPSRWTVAGVKAGMQTEMYSAPSAPGVLYRTHSPGLA